MPLKTPTHLRTATILLLSLLPMAKRNSFLKPMATPTMPSQQRQTRAPTRQGTAHADERYGMSVQTPVEQAMKASILSLFNEARGEVQLPPRFYQRFEAAIREGLAAYADDVSVLTDPDQQALLRGGVKTFLDDYMPDLMNTLRSSTERWRRAGQDEQAFGEHRVDTIVLHQTRIIRTTAQLCSDLIVKEWDDAD